jgi:hypothetical protein
MVPRIGLVRNPLIAVKEKPRKIRTERRTVDIPGKRNGACRPRLERYRERSYCSLMLRALMIFAYFSYSFLK